MRRARRSSSNDIRKRLRLIKNKELIYQNGYVYINPEKIYVVSSFYHIPRVRLEVENVIKDKEIEYISTPSEAVSDKWWKNINSFKFLSMEYTKFLIVFVQYKVLGL